MKQTITLFAILFFMAGSVVTAQTIFFDGFENGEIPSNWTIVDSDGDSYSWETNLDYTPYEGNYCISSASYRSDVGALTPDNWLITPAISIPSGSVLTFFVGAQDLDWAGEHYAVLISTTGNNITDFTTILFEETLPSTENERHYYQRIIDLSAYSDTVYIAFRHYNSTDMHNLNLDNITIEQLQIPNFQDNIVYVKENGSGDKTGVDWNNAMDNLQDALAIASYIDTIQIWVAAGTYYGDSIAGNNAFAMADGVNVYGGFTGNEPADYDLNLRNIETNETVLDGQNVQRVLYQAADFTDTTMWDGFTIRNGHTNQYQSGGGAYLRANSVLSHCDITDNISSSGTGGVYASSSTLTNCNISNNQSSYEGGGVYASSSTLANCNISNNTSNRSGGGVYAYSNSQFINCDIVNNQSTYSSGGVYNDYLSNTYTNCIIWGNRRGAIADQIYGSGYFTYCAVEGGYEGTLNINLASANNGTDSTQNYVAFVDVENGNFQLFDNSACIDAGNSSQNHLQTDIAGKNRIYGYAIDIGAYEYSGETYCVQPLQITVSNVLGTSAYVAWENGNQSVPQYYVIEYSESDQTNWTTRTTTNNYLFLTDLTPQTSYKLRVKCACDSSFMSVWSHECVFRTSCYVGTEDLTIGEGTNSTSGNRLPTNIYYRYSYTQQIFTDRELGNRTIDIDKISFQYFNSSAATRNLTIYVGTTDQTCFNGTSNYIPLSDLTQVFDGNVIFNNQGEDYWVTIDFNTSYFYNGVGNLVIAVDDNTGSYQSSSEKFYTHSTSDSKSISFYQDNNNISPSAPTSSSSVVLLYRNNIKIPGACESVGCPSPNFVIRDVTCNQAKVVWYNGMEGTVCELQYKEQNEAEWHEILLNNDTISINNLIQNTDYEVRMRTVCDPLSISNWNIQSFKTASLPIEIVYVTETGSGHKDGTSWDNATANLTWAINTAAVIANQHSIDARVWVAAGTYYGDSSATNNAFSMMEGVNVYGGFAGNEPANYDLSLRNFETNVSILDGQKVQRVLYQASPFTDTTIWDGFTIQNGKATNQYGGGVYLRAYSILSQCKIINNKTTGYYYGGGLYANGSSKGSIKIINCQISNNTGYDGGGAYIYCATLINCLINNNTSSYIGGGVCASYNAAAVNCDIVNNQSSSNGGGIYGESSQSAFNNCIVWGNKRETTIDNIYGNSSISYCAVEGGYRGKRNISLFSQNTGAGFLYSGFTNPTTGAGVDYTGGDWTLQDSSICINRGDTAGITLPITDLGGNSRVQNGRVDMGCYESSNAGVIMPDYTDRIIYVAAGGRGNRTGVDWDNAVATIQEAVGLSRMIDSSQVWVAAGTYYGDSIAENNAFTMMEGVNVYGGFAGNEPANYDLSLRDFETNVSILDGQKVQRVLYQASPFTDTTTWDGFTIQNGKTMNQHGGGVYLQTYSILTNCKIINNTSAGYYYGGGLYAYGASKESIKITNCQISNNTGCYGGGAYINCATLTNCIINNNTSSSAGGGIYAGYNSAVVNCDIVSNQSSSNGGGIYGESSQSAFNNCIVWGNKRETEVDNIYGNSSISYCAVEGGCRGKGNISLFSQNTGAGFLYPGFTNPTTGAGVDYTGGDWTLQDSSICINRGDTAGITLPITDLGGNSRVQNGKIDMGCYESSNAGVIMPVYTDRIIYVAEGGRGNRTGADWDNAVATIQEALLMTFLIDSSQVWVAAGTYYGDGNVDNNAFTMMEGVNVYGGFAGNEPANYDLSLRDFETNASVLDGQQVQRVLCQPSGFSEETRSSWDGFTIQNGRVTAAHGAGVFLRDYSTLSNCKVIHNVASNYSYGGGIYATGNNYETIKITDCQISNNTAENGGGVFVSNAYLVRCRIDNNTSSSEGGGAYLSYSKMINCLITQNTGTLGGGVLLSYSNSSLINCDIVRNQSSSNGGGVFAAYSNSSLDNCIIWGNKSGYVSNNIYGNVTCNYCAVEEIMPTGTNNIMVAGTNDGSNYALNYVRFMDPENGNYQLHPTSMCVDAGDPNYVPQDTTDLMGHPRVLGNQVDIGCYESEGESSCPSVVNLTVNNVTSNTALLKWKSMGSETQWLVAYHLVSNSDVQYLSVNDTVCSLTGLLFNRDYTAKVRAVCSDSSQSFYSIPVNFSTECDSSNLTLSDFSDDFIPIHNSVVYQQSVVFSWSNIPEATSYDFYLWRASEQAPSMPTVAGLTNSFITYNLPDYGFGNQYNWKIVVHNECIKKIGEINSLRVYELPNLHVTQVSMSNPVAGQVMTVEWTVRNDGSGSTPPGASWKDNIWLSTVDGVGGGFWYNVEEVRLAEVQNLTTLDAGESYTNSAQVLIPEDYVGNYFLFVMSDQNSAVNIDYSPTGNTTAPIPYSPDITGVPYPFLASQTTSYPGNFIRSQLAETVESDNFFYKLLSILPPPAPDLFVSDITHPTNTFSGSSVPLTFTVINQGEAIAPGNWQDAVYISSESVLNMATAEHLGTFPHQDGLHMGQSYTQTVNVVIPLTYMGDYYVYVKTDIVDQVYESVHEDNNTSASQSTINVTLTPPPDLVVTAVTVPAIMSANYSYNVSFTVKNQGINAVPAVGWHDAVYLSRNSSLDERNATLLKTIWHSNDTQLAADSSYTVHANINIPSQIEGEWYVFVKTDQDNRVFEYLYEDNNMLRQNSPSQIVLPDLIVSKIVLPDPIDPNSPVSVSWVVKNIGQGIVFNTQLKDEIFFDGVVVADVSGLVTIAGGDSVVRTKTISWPCNTTSNANISIKTNASETVYESLINNTTAHEVVIHYPDLMVQNVNFVDSCGSGDIVELNWDVVNRGNSPVNNTVTDKIYIGTSSSPNINAATLVGTFQRSVNLNVGDTEQVSFPITVPNGIQGTYYVFVVINAGQHPVCEGANSEANTGNGVPVEVTLSPYPDLQIASLTTTTSPIYMGGIVTLDYTIRNTGIADVNNRTWTDKFYLSPGPVFNESTAKLLGEQSSTTSISVNGTVNRSTSFVLPSNFLAGQYYLMAIADAGDDIYEYDGENNNTYVGSRITVSVYPLDLVTRQIDGYETVDWGQQLQYTLVVDNTSAVPTLSNYWVDALYLSSDALLSGNDIVLKKVNHAGIVVAGTSYQSPFTVTIPYRLSGNYYLIAVADLNTNNPEINSQNNVIVKPITINSVATADLSVSDAEVLDPFVSGQAARIAYTVTNVSQVPIVNKQWSDKIYLSSDNDYSIGDNEIKTVAKRRSLEVNQSYRDTVTVVVPLPINGNLFFIVKANANNDFFETALPNNILAVPVTVSLPLPGDLIVDNIISESELVSGNILHVSWQVKNIADQTLSGNGLRSLLYMSTDRQFDANDKWLGSVSNSIVLPSNAFITQNLTTRISGVPEGDYYLIVKTDVSNAFNETNDTNNTTVAAYPFSVSIRNLPFNVPLSDTLTDDLANDYKLNIGDNKYETVRIHLHSSDSLLGAINTIYVSHNTIGNNLNYTYSSIGQFTANPELYIPSTLPDYYGVNIIGATPAGDVQSMRIQADILPFDLRTIAPNYGGNTGVVTVELTGSKFREDMKVWLTNSNGTIYADTVIFDSYYRAFAQFDLTGQPIGTYTVGALNLCEGEVFLENGFEIRAGEPDGLATNLIFPNSPRPNRNIVMMLEFGNNGNVDINAPVIRLVSVGQSWIALSPDEVADHALEISIPLQIEGEPQGVLRPGSYGIINVYGYTANTLVFTIKRVQ